MNHSRVIWKEDRMPKTKFLAVLQTKMISMKLLFVDESLKKDLFKKKSLSSEITMYFLCTKLKSNEPRKLTVKKLFVV